MMLVQACFRLAHIYDRVFHTPSASIAVSPVIDLLTCKVSAGDNAQLCMCRLQVIPQGTKSM